MLKSVLQVVDNKIIRIEMNDYENPDEYLGEVLTHKGEPMVFYDDEEDEENAKRASIKALEWANKNIKPEFMNEKLIEEIKEHIPSERTKSHEKFFYD